MATDHLLRLGKQLGNLQSLECLLRAYLLKNSQDTSGSALGPSYWSLEVGDVVAVDEFTNYDSLGQLIDKLNLVVESRGSGLALDRTVVEIRDLLAHGRVASAQPDLEAMRLIKFDKPSRDGTVRVVASATMDDAWFDAGTTLTYDQLMKAHAAFEKLAN